MKFIKFIEFNKNHLPNSLIYQFTDPQIHQ